MSNYKQESAEGYIRLSSRNQEDGMSRKTQEKECRKYCEKNGIILRNIYYENKSAIEPYKRPVLNAIIARQKTKDKADIIVTYSLNRLTRNHPDFYFFRELVDKHDTKIVFVKENIIIQKPFKSYEKYLTNILISNAEFEVEYMNEIRKIGLIERAKTGKRPSKLPYGYDLYKKRIVIIPKEAEFVKKAFELYATGKYSLKTLTNELVDIGLKYKSQPDGKIPRASLANMLKNEFYTGWYTYPGVEEPIKGKYKAIIDKDLFTRVQNILKISAYEKIRKHNFLYSKLITLKDTNKFMTGEIKKDKYIYYTAIDNDDLRHSVNETVITETILNYFKEIRLNMIPDELIDEVFKNEMKPMTKEYSTLKRNISRKYHSKLRLNRFIKSKNIHDKDFIDECQNDIDNKYNNLPEKITNLENKIQAIKSEYKITMENRLYDIYILLENETQRKILELVKNKLEYQDKFVKMTFKSAFRKIRKR